VSKNCVRCAVNPAGWDLLCDECRTFALAGIEGPVAKSAGEVAMERHLRGNARTLLAVYKRRLARVEADYAFWMGEYAEYGDEIAEAMWKHAGEMRAEVGRVVQSLSSPYAVAVISPIETARFQEHLLTSLPTGNHPSTGSGSLAGANEI